MPGRRSRALRLVLAALAPPLAALVPVLPIPTVAGTGPVPLSVRVPDDAMSSFWQGYGIPAVDASTAGAANVGYLDAQDTTMKAVTFTVPSNVQANIATAQQNHVSWLLLDYEGATSCDDEVAAISTDYPQVKAAGLSLMFSPTGVMLQKCWAAGASYQQAFTTYSDALYFQTERLQSSAPSAPAYARQVESQIAAIKAVRAEPVWCQVSVNPQGTTWTATQVEAYVDALAAYQPDDVQVFWSSGNEGLAETVIEAYRVPH